MEEEVFKEEEAEVGEAEEVAMVVMEVEKVTTMFKELVGQGQAIIGSIALIKGICLNRSVSFTMSFILQTSQ